MPLAFWTHNIDPFFIQFSENFGIRYYGLAYLAGFLASAGLLVHYHRRGRSPFDFNTVTDLITVLVFGVLVGGRLGFFLLYQVDTLRTDPFGVFRVWEGGMASHGGFIGVLIAMWWWARRHRVSMLQVGDLIVTTAPVGLLFGRIANFINGELVGRITTVPWAVIFPHNEIDRGLARAFPRHPSQLYEAALEGALLLAYMQLRFWRRDPARVQHGRLSGEFLIAYAVVRVVGEQFREPDAPPFFGLNRGVFYSLFMVIAGVGLLVFTRRKADVR